MDVYKYLKSLKKDEYFEYVKSEINSMHPLLFNKIKNEIDYQFDKAIELYHNNYDVGEVRNRLLLLNIKEYTIRFDIEQSNLLYKYGLRGIDFLICRDEIDYIKRSNFDYSYMHFCYSDADYSSILKYLDKSKDRFNLYVDSSFLNLRYVGIYDYIFEKYNLNSYRVEMRNNEFSEEELNGLIYYTYKNVSMHFLDKNDDPSFGVVEDWLSLYD